MRLLLTSVKLLGLGLPISSKLLSWELLLLIVRRRRLLLLTSSKLLSRGLLLIARIIISLHCVVILRLHHRVLWLLSRLHSIGSFLRILNQTTVWDWWATSESYCLLIVQLLRFRLIVVSLAHSFYRTMVLLFLLRSILEVACLKSFKLRKILAMLFRWD